MEEAEIKVSAYISSFPSVSANLSSMFLSRLLLFTKAFTGELCMLPRSPTLNILPRPGDSGPRVLCFWFVIPPLGYCSISVIRHHDQSNL